MNALCLDHKMTLWHRGIAMAALQVWRTACRRKDCAICNGTFRVNQEISKREIERKVKCLN